MLRPLQVKGFFSRLRSLDGTTQPNQTAHITLHAIQITYSVYPVIEIHVLIGRLGRSSRLFGVGRIPIHAPLISYDIPHAPGDLRYVVSQIVRHVLTTAGKEPLTDALERRPLTEVLLNVPARSLAGANCRRVSSFAAVPGADRNRGVVIGCPLIRSTRMGSARLPVSVFTSTTLGPSGAKCLLPHVRNDQSTGRKSRPRTVSVYSSRGGWSL